MGLPHFFHSFAPFSPCSFPAAHSQLSPVTSLSLQPQRGVRVLDAMWHVKEQCYQTDRPYIQNTLPSQLMSHQIKGNYRPGVVLMGYRDSAVTPEQCQDKCHTITQHNTAPLWPLNNLSLNFHKKFFTTDKWPNPPGFHNPCTVFPPLSISLFFSSPELNLFFSSFHGLYCFCLWNWVQWFEAQTNKDGLWETLTT